MDGVRDIGGTDKLHAGIIGGIQMSKAVLGYDGTLKADALGLPQTLLQIRYTSTSPPRPTSLMAMSLSLTGQSRKKIPCSV